jgi:Domain of unknown function (DUF4262)
VELPEPEILKWLLEERQRIERVIAEYGVFIQAVGGDTARRSTVFAYTIGLREVGHPELLVLGLNVATMHGLLNEVARRIRSGDRLEPGNRLTFEQWSPQVIVEDLPNPENILFGVTDYYGSAGPAYQLTYHDSRGRFPWDDGYAIPGWIQPRPGEFHA